MADGHCVPAFGHHPGTAQYDEGLECHPDHFDLCALPGRHLPDPQRRHSVSACLRRFAAVAVFPGFHRAGGALLFRIGRTALGRPEEREPTRQPGLTRSRVHWQQLAADRHHLCHVLGHHLASRDRSADERAHHGGDALFQQGKCPPFGGAGRVNGTRPVVGLATHTWRVAGARACRARTGGARDRGGPIAAGLARPHRPGRLRRRRLLDGGDPWRSREGHACPAARHGRSARDSAREPAAQAAASLRRLRGAHRLFPDSDWRPRIERVPTGTRCVAAARREYARRAVHVDLSGFEFVQCAKQGCR